MLLVYIDWPVGPLMAEVPAAQKTQEDQLEPIVQIDLEQHRPVVQQPEYCRRDCTQLVEPAPKVQRQ